MTTPNDLPSVGTEDARRLSTAGDCGDWSASHEGLGSSCYQAIKDDAGTVIALVVAYDRSVFSDPDTRTNARRLVACWNACMGVDAELLEANPAPFSELRAERDELSSRVSELEGATTLLLRHFPTDTDLIEAGWSFTDTEVAMKAHETARAALASKEQP